MTTVKIARPGDVGIDMETTPIIDIEQVSWGDSRRMNVLQDKIAQATDPEIANGYLTELQDLVARIFIHIPRSWLVNHAPPDSELDWTKGETQNWIKGVKYNQITAWLTALKDPETASGE